MNKYESFSKKTNCRHERLRLNNLAISYSNNNQPEKAILLFQTMLNGYEQQRKTYQNLSITNRQSWFGTIVPEYKNAVHFFVKQGLTKEAFHTTELCKARSLTEQYAERLADNSGILPAEEIHRLNELRQEIAANNTHVDEMLARGNIDAYQNLESKRDTLAKTYTEYRQSLQEKYPKYKELSEPSLVDIEEGKSMLPDNTTALEFLQHDEDVVAFVLDKDKAVSVALGTVVDLASKCSLYHDLLSYSTFNSMHRDNKYLWKLPNGKYKIIEENEPTIRNAIPITNWREVETVRHALATELGKALLEPLAPYLPSNSAWLISPDGDLNHIPFETLVYAGKPAIESADISYIQSLSILKLLQKRQHQNALQENQKDMMAMGDALYGNHTTEDTRNKMREIEQQADRMRGTASDVDEILDLTTIPWENLPGTAKEVDKIAELFPENKCDVYKKEAATEMTLKNMDTNGSLSQYKYLLFATHGIFVPQVPELSAIVLGQENNLAPANGYITVSKWMGYTLRSRLIYLSACETGLGKDEEGEGVIGLPYALCIAGNQDTVMSLWKVNDKTSSEFSVSFFKKICAGIEPVKALSVTKREFLMKKNKEYSDPASWSAFLLYGI